MGHERRRPLARRAESAGRAGAPPARLPSDVGHLQPVPELRGDPPAHGGEGARARPAVLDVGREVLHEGPGGTLVGSWVRADTRTTRTLPPPRRSQHGCIAQVPSDPDRVVIAVLL